MMNLFAISDVHLSFGVKNKNMNIFKGWDNYAERLLQNWNNTVGEKDTVVIAGDVSWGKTLEESLPDFKFIANELNGFKIVLKGNHDYWWDTLTRMKKFLADNRIDGIDFLHNNAFKVGNVVVCGTRGWINEDHRPPDKKVLLREAIRLESSIRAGLEIAENCDEIVVFLHYPPIYSYEENEYILEVLNKFKIKRVFSGHIHSSGMWHAFIGEKYGICFDIVSADSLKFTPKKVL